MSAELMRLSKALMKKIAFSLLVLCSLILIASCNTNNPVNTNGTGAIFGSVRLDDEYGLELPDKSGATVQLFHDALIVQSTQSATDGSFRFNNIESGIYHLRVSKADYITYDGHDAFISPDNQFIGKDAWKIEGGRLGHNVNVDTTAWQMSVPSYQPFSDTTNIGMGLYTSVDTDSNGHTHNVLITAYRVEMGCKIQIAFPHKLPKPELSRGVTLLVDHKNGATYLNSTQNLKADSLHATWIFKPTNTYLIIDSTGRVLNRTETAFEGFYRIHSQVPTTAVHNLPLQYNSTTKLPIEFHF